MSPETELKSRRSNKRLPAVPKKKTTSLPSLTQGKNSLSSRSGNLHHSVTERSLKGQEDYQSKLDKQLYIWMEFTQKRSEIIFLNSLMKIAFEQEGV